jgi:3-hexulose-6-phosphate synthase/6-phospho-3-hexuloisomerase
LNLYRTTGYRWVALSFNRVQAISANVTIRKWRKYMDATMAKLLESCARIGTSTWCDALEEFGIDGIVRGLTQRSGRGRFAGFAVTVRQKTAKKGSFPKSELGVGRFIDAMGPGLVLMIDMGGAEISTFGGLAAMATKLSGAAAVVIDGGCRDGEDLKTSDLWLAARHITPLTGKTRIRLEAMGEPITVGGVNVSQGDVVIGDETGIVVIPQGRLKEVMEVAEHKLTVDMEVEKGIRAGKSFAEAARQASYL